MNDDWLYIIFGASCLVITGVVALVRWLCRPFKRGDGVFVIPKDVTQVTISGHGGGDGGSGSLSIDMDRKIEHDLLWEKRDNCNHKFELDPNRTLAYVQHCKFCGIGINQYMKRSLLLKSIEANKSKS